jgi:hypothetical protein
MTVILSGGKDLLSIAVANVVLEGKPLVITKYEDP